MNKKAFTLKQADRVICILKQFTADVAKAASDAINELADAKADSKHQHTASDISDFPNSLPANGGNATTVNGHTVASDVPSGAKFTDTVYTHPAYTAKSSGLYKITIDATGHISAVTAVTKADITALGIPAQDTNTTYGAATASANGLMSSDDKSKLDGIAAGAQVNSITGVKGNSETAYRTGQVNLTAANIGAAAESHTHNYAGSSSAGGAATTALACTGNSATATKATQDSAGQQINTTYIKALSNSGSVITYTKGSGATGTLTLPSGVTEATVTSKIRQQQSVRDHFRVI